MARKGLHHEIYRNNAPTTTPRLGSDDTHVKYIARLKINVEEVDKRLHSLVYFLPQPKGRQRVENQAELSFILYFQPDLLVRKNKR